MLEQQYLSDVFSDSYAYSGGTNGHSQFEYRGNRIVWR